MPARHYRLRALHQHHRLRIVNLHRRPLHRVPDIQLAELEHRRIVYAADFIKVYAVGR